MRRVRLRARLRAFHVSLLWRLVPSKWVARLGWASKKISFAQHGEDSYVLSLLEAGGVAGPLLLVEVGAFDGVRYSPTLLIEQTRPSKSILIEASPKRAWKCRENRPEAEVLCAAIGASNRIEKFAGDYAVSGISEHLSARYLNRWGLENTKTFPVPVIALGEVLKDLEVGTVDFMSIDVQGAELEVLEGMDWSRKVRIISIELEGSKPERDQLCRIFLEEAGFIFRVRRGPNELWTSPDCADLGLQVSNQKVPMRLAPYATRQ